MVILLIFINCASMAAYRPMDGDDSQLNRFLANMEAWATVLFTVEVVLELAAAGSLQKYFRNYWNLFDFILVAAGYTRFLPFSNSTSAFKVKTRPTSCLCRVQTHRFAVHFFTYVVPLHTSMVICPSVAGKAQVCCEQIKVTCAGFTDTACVEATSHDQSTSESTCYCRGFH